MAKEKTTRGRASKINLLPESIQRELNALLSDKTYTQEDIRNAINELIDKSGLSPDLKLSRSGLNRYAVNAAEAGKKIREMNDISKQLINNIGMESSGDTSKLLIQMVRGLIFDVSLSLQNEERQINGKELKELATAIEKLEKSSSENLKREKEIRAQMAAEAASEAEREAKSAGLTDEAAAIIKNKILGIA
jgi:hypothetical protein